MAIFSTDIDNFYPSFDVPVVPELGAQEFLWSSLTLEVENIELSLYILICYKREDLVTQGLGDVTRQTWRNLQMLNPNLLPTEEQDPGDRPSLPPQPGIGNPFHR